MDPCTWGTIANLPLPELRGRVLALLRRGSYLSHDINTKGQRLHELGSCYRVPGVDHHNFTFIGAALKDKGAICKFCLRCFSAEGPVYTAIESDLERSSSSESDEECLG